MAGPFGIAVDPDDGTVYVAESWNNRVIAWKPGERGARVVTSQVKNPTDILFDLRTNSIIIADNGNNRIIRWPVKNGTNRGRVLIDNVTCWGLAMTSGGDLFVTDVKKHEVRRYIEGQKIGTIVAGGKGPGKGLHQLHMPYYIAVDDQHTIYVSDTENQRVVKWTTGASHGVIVGHVERGLSTNSSSPNPSGIVVDTDRRLYVVDKINHRILRFQNNKQNFDVLIKAPHLDRPHAIAFDHRNNLYVADRYDRIQKFSIIEAKKDLT